MMDFRFPFFFSFLFSRLLQTYTRMKVITDTFTDRYFYRINHNNSSRVISLIELFNTVRLSHVVDRHYFSKENPRVGKE